MTVPSNTNRRDFSVGGPGPVDFPHRLDTAEELQLWVLDADGLKDVQATLNVDYTVSIAPDFQSASVMLLTNFLTPYTGRDAVLLRELPLTQALNVEQVQRFSDGEIEKGFDRSTMRDQQLGERITELGKDLSAVIADLPTMDAAASAAAAAASAAAAATSAAQAAAAPQATANFDWFQNG